MPRKNNININKRKKSSKKKSRSGGSSIHGKYTPFKCLDKYLNGVSTIEGFEIFLENGEQTFVL